MPIFNVIKLRLYNIRYSKYNINNHFIIKRIKSKDIFLLEISINLLSKIINKCFLKNGTKVYVKMKDKIIRLGKTIKDALSGS